jgi:hypothetical protein
MDIKEKIEEIISTLEDLKIENPIKEELIDILDEVLNLKEREDLVDKLEEFIYELENSSIEEEIKFEIKDEIEEVLEFLEK